MRNKQLRFVTTMSHWLAGLALLTILAAVITASVQQAAEDSRAVLLTFAMSCSLFGSLLAPGEATIANGFTVRLAWSAGAAICFLATVAIVATPLFDAPWQVDLLLAVGVLILVLLLSSLAALLNLFFSSESESTIVLVCIVGVAITAPLVLADLAGQSKSVLDTVIAASPLTYLATLIEYDYLKSTWFYQNTPFGGIRYDYIPVGASSLAYGVLIVLLTLATHWVGRTANIQTEVKEINS